MVIPTRVLLQICLFAACLYMLFIFTKPSGIWKKLKSPSRHCEQAISLLKSGDTSNTVNGSHSERIKRILLWSPLFSGMEFLSTGRETFHENRCEDTLCEITKDRKLLLESHAVVFHIRTFNVCDIPLHRLHHQKWIFFSMESPPYSFSPDFKYIDDLFNWTMTYRHDSDVILSYGDVLTENSRSSNYKKYQDSEALFKKKKKMVIWMVSHCSTAGNREEYVKDMQKYIDIDVIGQCGSAVCPSNQTKSCLESFARIYKFYLAFENSICDGYITEKLYRVLLHDIVPVVFGGGNYTHMFPPKSFINALEYTPQELAHYLQKISSNASLYLEYFKWKSSDYVVNDSPVPCDLCKKMHSESFVTSSQYENITEWWVTKSNCTSWKPS